MDDDSELLRRYAREDSEEAFAELVQRHGGLVYHAALRACGGDAHRAQDVAQAVFTAMARKARALMGRPSIAGWLYTSARYAAAQAVRTEVRRQGREGEAQMMERALRQDAGAAEWENMKPAIDEALQSLGAADREAVLLRFFERRSFAEVGEQLRLSEDAARMRIARSLEKMRAVLARRGLTSSAAALALVMEAHAATALPAGTAAGIVASALAGVAGGGSVASASILMSMSKIKIGVVIALLAAGSVGLVVQHRANVRLQADLDSLRQTAADNARLKAENGRLTQLAEAASSQAAVASASRLQAAAQNSPGRASVALAAGLTPIESLGNSGRATPRATFATQLWAARTGNVAVEASTLLLGPAQRAKLEALMANLPADVRAQYGTPEELLAFALAGSPHPVGGMEVLGETDNGPDDVTLQTEWQHTDDSVVHHSDVELRQESDGWKWVVPPVIVNRAVAYLGRM